jgi:TonB family protein
MRAYLSIGLFLYVSLSSTRAQYPLAGSAGVDAKGVRHTWDANPTKPAPYAADITKRVPPEYPFEARKARLEGAGLFRLQIDLATGKVIKATVLKSTGVVILDNSALWALRRWQFKPGTWKELDTPIAFSMSPPRL